MVKLVSMIVTCLLAGLSLCHATEVTLPSYIGERLGEPVAVISQVSGKTGTSALYSGDSHATGFQAEIVEYDRKPFVVRGALYDMWKNWGKQDKRFGFPTTDQYNFGGPEDWRQDFEGGYLIYRKASNLVMVYPDGYTSPTGGFGLGQTPPKVAQVLRITLRLTLS